MIIVLVILVIAISLFITEKLPVDLVALLIMGILLLSGIITPEQGISGFSNTATITVGAMFILSAALFKTGVVNKIGEIGARIFKHNFWIGLVLMMVIVGGFSAFINNTPVVALFIPLLLKIAKDTGTSPSRLLMPISFASMFGGVCTLIGTSTNILIDSIAESRGLKSFDMFEFSSLGIIFFGVGTIYMITIGIHLIPKRRKEEDLTDRFGMGDYLTEIVLLPGAKSIGKSVKDAPLVKELGIEILEVWRQDQRIQLPQSKTILQENDVLKVMGDVEKVNQLGERFGIVLKSKAHWNDNDLQSEEVMLVEAVVAPNSILENKTIKEVGFSDIFDATALAIRHRGKLMHYNLGNTKIKGGDALLIEVKRDDFYKLKDNETFVIVAEADIPQFQKNKLLPAATIMAGVIITAALNILPIVTSAIVGCVLMVLTKCVTLDEAYKAINWQVIFLLAGALTLGVALEKTGTALFISNILVSTVGSLGPTALVAAFYVLTTVLTETMSNNATAALIAPIAIVAAESLNIDPRPLLMAVAFAASASFLTPVGYQTNTMIYGAGQYKFTDFMRVGAPLNIIFFIIAVILIPKIWPL